PTRAAVREQQVLPPDSAFGVRRDFLSPSDRNDYPTADRHACTPWSGRSPRQRQRAPVQPGKLPRSRCRPQLADAMILYKDDTILAVQAWVRNLVRSYRPHRGRSQGELAHRAGGARRNSFFLAVLRPYPISRGCGTVGSTVAVLAPFPPCFGYHQSRPST